MFDRPTDTCPSLARVCGNPEVGPVISLTTLKSRTAKDLAALAKCKGVPGWHAMRKEDLIKALVKLGRVEETRSAKPAKKASTNGSANGNGVKLATLAAKSLAKVGSNGNGRSISGNGISGNGISGNGISGNGISGNGVSGNGISGNGVSGNGASANGVAKNGSSGKGASANGVSTNGNSVNGAARQAASGNGNSANGKHANGSVHAFGVNGRSSRSEKRLDAMRTKLAQNKDLSFRPRMAARRAAIAWW